MESWCALVSSYSDEPEPKSLAKALRTANTLISGDLALFEIEWLVQTLFFKPVDVLNTIATKKSNEDWLKNIADSFKVISKLVCKYWNVLDKYHETIVKLCMLPYDAQTKKDAINCLNNILKNPGVDAGNAKRHIDALEGATTCKAPLAILVGNICRYCPEAINQEHNRIWRVYLNMLQHQNITDNVMNAILQGIDGLFENFGRDLPTAELNNFYSDLSRKCAKMPKCIEPLLSILKSRPGLFKEKLREDQVLRMYLWGINSPSVKDALLSVYTAIFELVTEEERRRIISTEIQPRINSESSLVKHTALRVAFKAKIVHGVTIPNIYRPDALEFQIRRRMISHQEADLVSLCLESQESYVKSLLVTVIMYYDNIPVSLRQRIVVEGVTGTTDDIRRVAITLLIELCRQDGGLEKYAELWRCLLDSESVKQCHILEDTLKHIVLLIRTFLEAPVKDSDQMLSLSSVLSFILSVTETDRSSQHCELLRPVIVELASALCICPATLLTCKFICVEMFKDDSLLKELLSTFKDVKRDDSLSLMQEIFGKDTVEAKLQIRALIEMDSLLKSNNSLDYRRVPHIIMQILKLKFKRNILTTDDRVLQRDLSLFIGEHGHLLPKESFTDELYSLDLHNNINITIPNVADGKNYKIDLLRILQIALMHEDFDALYCILLIIAVNLRDRPEPGIQNIVWRVVHAIFRSSGSVDAAPALRMCATAACVLQAIQTITEETNAEVRRQLCDGLEVILLQDPGSEKAGELLTMVADELVLMINCLDQQNYEAGLEITRIFLNTLRDNDSLAISYLPQIITLLSKQITKELYKSATDIFIDKIDIFEDEKLNEIITGIVRNILFIDNKIHIEYILEILKKIFELRDYDGSVLVREIFDGVNLDAIRSDTKDITDINFLKFINALLILALAKPELEFSDEICNTVITTDDIIDKINVLLNKDTTVRVQQNICKFLNEYGVRLLEINKEETLKCLSSLIGNLSPTSLPIIKNDVSACLCTYKTILTELPTEITNSYYKCCQKLNIEDITEELKRIFNMTDLFGTNDVSEEIADKIQALSIMVDIFDMAIPNTDIWTDMVLENKNRVRYTIASNLLSVSEKSISKSNFENILRDDQTFVMEYMSVYFERVLLSDRIVMETSLFIDVLKYYVNNNNNKYVEKHFDRMLDVIERVWPMFEALKFESKLSLVLDILRLPKNPGLISPIRWMISAVTAEDTRLDNKIKMITLLPRGDEYSPCYRHMAGTLPVLLSEMVGDHAAVLRALLDSLANSGDLGLLEIVCTFAAADDSRGWWDDAMDACMASLADRRDESIYDAAYKSCKERSGLGVCRRVFLPLLKHSSRIFCEEYISTIIPDVLLTLKIGFKEPTNTEIYRERVLSQVKAFNILQVAIEKLPPKSLESGTINIKAGSQDPWYLVKVICMRGYASLSKPVQCPENASDRIREACLRLQCSAYNCLVTAICKRRPSQKQYAAVFGITPWTNIVDPEVEYDFAPKAYWADNKSRRSGRTEGQGTSGVGTTLTYTGTVRTRIFLTTLSENPLQYDMIPNEEEEEEFEEEKPTGYDNHPLNKYGCLSAMTTLLAHSSTLEHTDWLNTVAEGLNSNLPVNAKWTLAQAICNVEENLKSHASVLAPALIQLVAATPRPDGDKKLLNNLHIDILWTVFKWNIPELPNYSDLSLCIQYLISTCIEHRSQEAVSRRLLNTLNTVLQMYGTKVDVDWSALQKYCDDMPNTAFFLIPIFLRILKNGVTIPGLLDNILTKFDAKLWISTSRLPEVFGLALSLERFKDGFLAKFWQILGIVKTLNVSAYVKVLMYAQRADSKCCNRQHFRIITDLASKVERPKCLSIIAVYLDSCVEENSCSEVFETIGLKELLDGEYTVEAMKVVNGGLKFMEEDMKADIVNTVAYNCGNSSPAIRKQAFAVILKVFQDLVTVKHDHSAKKRALQGTPILDALESPTGLHDVVMKEVSRGVFDKDEEIAKLMRDGIELCLSKDMTVRYAELFYIIFYLARRYSVELSQCGHVLLDLLFRDVKRHDEYSDVKLSDQPLAPSDVINIGYMTYGASNVMVGQKQKPGSQRRELDVQTPVGDIFEMFVQSAKRDSQICQDLCLKVLKCLQGQAPGGRFHLDSVMARLLADMLKEPPSSMTPFVLEASRIFLDSVNSIVGLKDSLSMLKRRVVNAEALAYYNVLIEDLELRSKGRGLFDFRLKEELDIEMGDENLQFSIEGLTEVFGHLSNWDDLRIQDRDRIEKQLPLLMTGDVRFESCVKNYFEERHSNLDYNLWFNKMVGSYVSSKLGKTVLQFKENWLRDIEQWPTRDFVTAAVIEAIKWPADDTVAACDIRSTDCLAEWAARLMIRASYFEDNPRKRAACRAEELKFCSEANRRQLPALALQCIERNKDSLLEEEALPWFQENVRARRLISIREHDISKLQKALDAAESQDENTSICLKKLILQLRNDLEVLTKPKLDEILASINETTERDHISPFKQDSDTLRSVYELTMDHYDELWEADVSDTSIQAEIISGMATLIQNMLDHNLAKDCNLLISMLLNRLAQFDGLLSEETAKKILDQIVVMLPSLDAYSTDHLKSNSAVFPSDVWQSYNFEKEEPLGLCKEYLQLVCDPAYTLARYCEELSKDWSCWQTISSRIKSKFDSSYRGTDYISLNTIKKKLFALDNTDSRARDKQLKAITTELFKKLAKPVLRLSQLSPELSKDAILEGQRENFRKLLGLPPSVYVVKFSEQIQVFVDAIRRPCVLSAVLSNGSTKKYIIKSGEVLANDASVQRAIAVLPKLFEGQVRSYNVTTLSEDCAIIEYLENYQRLQELMGDKVRIPVERLNNDKLVLSPSLALEQHNTLCNKIPVYTLRSSIEDRCASMQEFIAKKRMFTDTLATMTISNWLFGVGDRHLHNIMMNRQDGGVCGVDMASVFEFGLRECVPARLTGNLLAVCDVEVLESRLQSMLICLRQSRKLYESFIRISFYWKGRDFSEITYIQNILQGSVVSYQVTRDVIEKSSIKNKQEYLNILDSVFENFVEKPTYSVEEQVSRLLQHCTDPKLLSITPRGWEAWV